MTQLLKFLAENRRPFTPIQSRVVAQGGKAAIYLYDPIVSDRVTAEWWGGICPQDFVPALRALDADEITIYTNCPGGDVFAAEAMCQALREHGAKITMQIEGYAASAATSIACACDEVIMTPASKYMIHKTWTLAMGNEDDMLSAAALLKKCDLSMYDEYHKRTNADMEQIEAWCAAETWFTAEEAIKYGFADRLADTATASSKATRTWNLSAFANAPAPAIVADDPVIVPPEEKTISSDHRERQLQRLALLNHRTRQ